ncbi:phosphoglucomutase [Paenibacillus sp. FSL H8-0259]|uniref:phosphoglucomutase n=1 Tax=Paenibacillus sp. FSL H8-0259 TaxID=1920423 RepID=UPI00096FF783|nr:phosphoglucomutase [Paenibacillus sp. FSL H8-0259]OMF23379.1 phosphoglucomutase [Paenibacillus sp. FSL H8-0259]
MGYPEQIDVFQDKLNKKANGSSYVVEEKLLLTGGVYSGLLAHDNINNQTLSVYTGSRYSGTEVRNYSVSFPDEAPWRRMIKIYADVPEVYVTYETPGDTVEADDVNQLQSGLTATQSELERYKKAGLIDGGSFKREV